MVCSPCIVFLLLFLVPINIFINLLEFTKTHSQSEKKKKKTTKKVKTLFLDLV